jgi:nucleotide-binding universal stress UspA family protein
MFKHLLVPSDGSPASEAAARMAAYFARDAGARITALTVKPFFHPFTLRPEELEDTRGDTWNADLHARKFLAVVEAAARAEGVPVESVVETSDRPWQVIVETARARGCDLIAMASHGRTGAASLFLGSQTQRVLANSPVPVLVIRP